MLTVHLTMITLNKRLKCESGGRASSSGATGSSSSSSSSSSTDRVSTCPSTGRASIRDRLLVKEVQEMEQTLPVGCKVKFEDPNALHDFCLSIVPEDGYWAGGKFRFRVTVGDDYNLSPPSVRCLTRLWHPNINEEGDVCLSILRLNSVDGHGWQPTRKLKDVIWGLSSLFGDLLNFDDPLNYEAAEHFQADKDGFKAKVKDWVNRYAKR